MRLRRLRPARRDAAAVRPTSSRLSPARNPPSTTPSCTPPSTEAPRLRPLIWQRMSAVAAVELCHQLQLSTNCSRWRRDPSLAATHHVRRLVVRLKRHASLDDICCVWLLERALLALTR